MWLMYLFFFIYDMEYVAIAYGSKINWIFVFASQRALQKR